MRSNIYTLYVIRDDDEYDYKEGFKSYEEANNYREECQRGWINHTDYVYLLVRNEIGRIIKEVNLTKITEEERAKLLQEAGIPMK